MTLPDKDNMGPLLIVPIAAAIALITEKKIEEVMALAMFTIVGILYLSGLIATLIPGIYFSVFFIIVATAYDIYFLIKNPHRFTKCIISTGMLAYLIYAIYFMGISYQRGLTFSDDLRCWGLGVKNYYFYSDFLTVKATDQSILHPPAILLWNYFSTKMWITYSESICLFSQDMMTIAVLLPLFSKVKSLKQRKEWLVSFITVLLVPTVGNNDIYLSLGTDCLLGLFTAYAICMFLLWQCYRQRIYLICFMSGLFMLSLTKRSGILLGAIVLISVCADQLFMFLHHNMRKSKILLCTVCELSTFTIPITLWDMARMKIGLIVNIRQSLMVGCGAILLGTFIALVFFEVKEKRVKPEALIAILMFFLAGLFFIVIYYNGKKNLDYAYAMANTFFYNMFYTERFEIGSLITLSFSLFLILAVLERYLFRQYVQKKVCTDVQIQERDLLMLGVCTGTVFYVLMLLNSYIVTIGPANGEDGIFLPSYNRYLLPCVLLVIYMAIFRLCTEGAQYGKKVYFLIIIITLLVANPVAVISPIFSKVEQAEFHAFEHGGIKLKAGDRVFLIAMTPSGTEPEQNVEDEFYYYVFPAKSEFKESLLYTEDQKNRRLVTVDELTTEIRKLKDNYVYIQTIYDGFEQKYASLFENPEEIGTGRVYSVNYSNDGSIKLKLLAK